MDFEAAIIDRKVRTRSLHLATPARSVTDHVFMCTFFEKKPGARSNIKSFLLFDYILVLEVS